MTMKKCKTKVSENFYWVANYQNRVESNAIGKPMKASKIVMK